MRTYGEQISNAVRWQKVYEKQKGWPLYPEMEKEVKK